MRYLRRLDALEVCSSTALSQALGPLLLQPQRAPGVPEELIYDAISITEMLIGWAGRMGGGRHRRVCVCG